MIYDQFSLADFLQLITFFYLQSGKAASNSNKSKEKEEEEV